MRRFPIYRIMLIVLFAAAVGAWFGSQPAQAQESCLKWNGCCLGYCHIRYTFYCATWVCQVEICSTPSDNPYCQPPWGDWYTDTCVGYGWPACSNPAFFFCPLTCA